MVETNKLLYHECSAINSWELLNIIAIGFQLYQLSEDSNENYFPQSLFLIISIIILLTLK